MSLELYKKKRDFSKTSEPPAVHGEGESLNRFVVQEHHASHLHYDFRLEMDGVLKSWAVPKGPPPTSGIRRLAVQTEDHPLQYLTFAGTIPEGSYGAGEMYIWDSGTYESVADKNPVVGVNRGKLELLIHGEKLVGKYDLIRTDDEKNNWIFIKTKMQPAEQTEPTPDVVPEQPVSLPKGAKAAPFPDPASVSPMLAITKDKPFDDAGWQFEIKWDGYRALTFLRESQAEVYSRNHQRLSNKVPEFVNLNKWFRCQGAVIDGEIVVLDEKGIPNFQQLQDRFGFQLRSGSRSKRTTPSDSSGNFQLVYMVFDVLYVDGHNVSSCPLAERRNILKKIVAPGGPVRFSDHVDGDGKVLFKHVESMDLEGVIAKKSSSAYVQHRSNDWVKVKTTRTMDAVIAGFTESPAVHRPFGSLILGQYADGVLTSVGHVGTGFDQETMGRLIGVLQPLETSECPFETVPPLNGKTHWVKPQLVCEVKYATVTDDGQLRQPVFLHLRPDKPATESSTSECESTDGRRSQELGSVDEPLVSDSKVDKGTVDCEGNRVSLTNLNKVYWPKTQATKRDLLRYYELVAGAILPHLAERPIVVERYPNGVDGEGFFQHDMSGKGNHGHKHPGYVLLYSVMESSGKVDYAVCNNLSALLYMVNLGSIPIHCWNIKTANPEHPDRLVFDFDPSDNLSQAIDAAMGLKELLDQVGLKSFPKTSGANGLHVYVPVDPRYDSDLLMSFSKLLGKIVEHRLPKLVTLERRIKSRGVGKVYLDCVQNRVGKTVVAPYSARACDIPTVSAPLAWNELSTKLRLEEFTIESMPERVRSQGDLFSDVLNNRQVLAEPFKKLNDDYAEDVAQLRDLVDDVASRMTENGRGKN